MDTNNTRSAARFARLAARWETAPTSTLRNFRASRKTQIREGSPAADRLAAEVLIIDRIVSTRDAAVSTHRLACGFVSAPCFDRYHLEA